MIGLIYLIYKFFFSQAKGMTKEYQMRQTYTDALSTLNKRLANGEITTDEYNRLRTTLDQSARK